jgi:hypothetical protein
MSKKTTTKQTQTLSPEKYIRQKSRNLPLYKCWINTDWEEQRMANIAIARKHANDNVTVCIYLVDLACLGVKDTQYFFNIPLEDFENMLSKSELEFDDTLSYSLAHNIIFSALEFAEEYGFKPHKDYTQTTCFFLEEDNDDIPLIEVECGGKKDGKPFYINAGHDSPARAKQIIAQLEKTAGEGNYHYLSKIDRGEYDDDYDEITDDNSEEELAVLEELSQLKKEEQKTLFCEIFDRIEKKETDEQDFKRLVVLSRLLVPDMISEAEINKYWDILEQDLNHPLTKMEELPNSLFSGVENKEPEELYNLFFDTLDALDDKAKGKKAIEVFRDEMGDVPVSCYMELTHLEQNEKRKFAKKLEEYHTKYPDYFLIQLKWYVYLSQTEKNSLQRSIASGKIQTLLYETKQPVTDYEFNEFLFSYIPCFIMSEESQNKTNTLARIVAIEHCMTENKEIIDDNIWTKLIAVLTAAKVSVIAACLAK